MHVVACANGDSLSRGYVAKAVRLPHAHPLSGCVVNGRRYLVDPASSHMLVSKIKPCMSKYELIQTVKLRMAH